MGTSKGYEAPTTPEWRAVKRDVSVEAPNGAPNSDVAARIVGGYIAAAGGSRGIARGGGSLGRAKAAQRVAASVAGFFTDVAQRGLQEALTRVGLAALIGRPIAEVLNGLLNALAGPANSLDDVDARNALSRLQEELLRDAATVEDVERIMTENAEDDAVATMMDRFYMHYLFEQFCRVFYERLVARVGDATAESFLSGIKDFLQSALQERVQARGVTGIDWGGAEGRTLADELLERTLMVFGGE